MDFAYAEIYIPIWIDLKVKSATEITTNLTNLHSNMDRFESRHINDTVVIISYDTEIVNISFENKFEVIFTLSHW